MATIDEKLSVFPNDLDSFNEVFDLSYSQTEKAKRLSELKLQETLNNEEQQEVARLTSELRDNMITPAHWNKFASALYAVQKFFKNNVQDFILNKQKVWDSYIKQFTHVGEWQEGFSYKFQNIVSSNQGDIYLCKKDHISTSDIGLSNTEYWVKASFKGDKGDIGLNATYRGDWSAITSYNIGDAVCHVNTGINGGLIYIARTVNTGKNPSTNHNDWLLYSQVYVGVQEPLGAGKGLHFIEVID